MKLAGSSDRISVEHKRNEGSLNNIPNNTKFFTLYADDFIKTAENYLNEGKSANMVETIALDRFHNLMVSVKYIRNSNNLVAQDKIFRGYKYS